MPFSLCVSRTINGTSSTIRGSPPTISVSLSSERICPLARALAIVRSASRRTRGDRASSTALFVDRVVPDLEIAHLGVAAHPPAVARTHARRRLGGLGLVAAHEARGDGSARRQTLEIPFPRPGMDLVEIVDGEDQVALGRGVDAEIGDMHVAARRHRQPGDRRARQVVGHHCRRAAQEGEGRGQHARIAHRDQSRDAVDGLLLEDADGIGPVGEVS